MPCVISIGRLVSDLAALPDLTPAGWPTGCGNCL